MHSSIKFVTICLAACAILKSQEQSDCLRLWKEHGAVDERLVCADHQGDPDEEFVLYVFPGTSLEFTDEYSFRTTGEYDVKALNRPGQFVQISHPLGTQMYLCTQRSMGDRLFMMGETFKLFRVQLESNNLVMLCAFHDLD